MIWRNTAERYGAVAAFLHWLIALAIIGLLGLGLYMADLPNTPYKLNLFFWHKSFGIAVLTLAALRLVWRLVNIHPAPLANHKRWERGLAGLAHVLLYVSMFAMPLSGWIMSSAKGFKVSVFGWFTLPDLVGESKILAVRAQLFHDFWAWVLIAVAVLHAAGALKHHILDKDSTLRRMLPGVRLVLALFALAAPVSARAADWAIDPAQSRLSFEGTQMGAPFTGVFPSFGGDIVFDRNDLAGSHVRITIPMAGATTGSPDRDSYIGGKAWLDVESFPESVFESASFDESGPNQYVAHGTLTMRGVALPVDLSFTLAYEDGPEGNKIAKMDGQAVLKRLDFGIGAGEWADEKSVGNQVIVRVSLTAHEKTPAASPQ